MKTDTKKIRAINLDGTNDRALGAQATLSGSVAALSRLTDLFYLDSIVSCVPTVTGDTGCSNGVLGRYNNGDSQYLAVKGMPSIFTFTAASAGSSLSDPYLYVPGTAGSLVRLTNRNP